MAMFIPKPVAILADEDPLFQPFPDGLRILGDALMRKCILAIATFNLNIIKGIYQASRAAKASLTFVYDFNVVPFIRTSTIYCNQLILLCHVFYCLPPNRDDIHLELFRNVIKVVILYVWHINIKLELNYLFVCRHIAYWTARQFPTWYLFQVLENAMPMKHVEASTGPRHIATMNEFIVWPHSL